MEFGNNLSCLGGYEPFELIFGVFNSLVNCSPIRMHLVHDVCQIRTYSHGKMKKMLCSEGHIRSNGRNTIIHLLPYDVQTLICFIIADPHAIQCKCGFANCLYMHQRYIQVGGLQHGSTIDIVDSSSKHWRVFQ